MILRRVESFTNHDTVEQIEHIVLERHVSDSFMGLVRITDSAHKPVN